MSEVKTVSLAVFVLGYVADRNGLTCKGVTNDMIVQFLCDNYNKQLEKFVDEDPTNGAVEKIGEIAPGIYGVVIPHDLPFGVALLTCAGLAWMMAKTHIGMGVGVHLNRVDI